jgi:uncharacterized membrane protein
MESAQQPSTGGEGSDWGYWRLPALLLFLAVVLIAALLFAHNSLTSTAPWVNHDVAFHSYLGFEILEGSRLYVDLVDSNPPGSQFLLGALIGLADILGLPDFLIDHLFILALGLCGLFVLKNAFRERENALAFVLVALAFLLVVVRGNFSNNLFASAPQMPYDFGQREQIFSLLFLPYVMLRLAGRKPAAMLYPWLVLLGFVSMFKPYWPLLVGLVEACCLMRRERRSLPTIAWLLGGMLLPLLLLLLHSWDAFVEFFTVLIPIHLVGKYTYYDTTYTGFLGSPLHMQIAGGALLLTACLAWAFARSNIPRSDLLLMAVVAGGGYLSILHQHKFWSYHAMPLFGAVAVFSAFSAARAVGALELPRVRKAAAMILITVLVLLIAAGVANLYIMLDRVPPLGQELVPLLKGQDRVMFFSMSTDYIYAPLALRMRICGPWTAHWMMPALITISDPALRERELASYAAAVKGRIDDDRPEMLVFAPYRQALPPGESLHDIFRRLGVVPRPDYRRLPDMVLQARQPQLGGWIVYLREETQ